jgi:hypothetical protein
MSLMWMPAQTTRPPLRIAFNASGDEVPDGRIDDRRVERLGWRLVGATRPRGAEAPRERLVRNVSRTSEGVHGPPLPLRDLRHDVSRGAEAVDAKVLAIARDHKRSPADEPCAEQRRERHIRARPHKGETHSARP